MKSPGFVKACLATGALLALPVAVAAREECFRKISQGVIRTMSEAEQDTFREAHGFKRVGPPLRQAKAWQISNTPLSIANPPHYSC